MQSEGDVSSAEQFIAGSPRDARLYGQWSLQAFETRVCLVRVSGIWKLYNFESTFSACRYHVVTPGILFSAMTSQL